MIIILSSISFAILIYFINYKIKIYKIKKYWRNRVRPKPLLDINERDYIINYNKMIHYNIFETKKSIRFRLRYLNYTQNIKYLFFRDSFRPSTLFYLKILLKNK